LQKDFTDKTKRSPRSVNAKDMTTS